MDKETFSEFGHTVITVIMSSLIIAAITGSVFLGKVKTAINRTIPQSERYEYQCDDAFENAIMQND